MPALATLPATAASAAAAPGRRERWRDAKARVPYIVLALLTPLLVVASGSLLLSTRGWRTCQGPSCTIVRLHPLSAQPAELWQELALERQRVREGPYIAWHPNGEVSSTGSYSNDVRVGCWKFLDDDGWLRTHGVYLRGERHGTWIERGGAADDEAPRAGVYSRGALVPEAIPESRALCGFDANSPPKLPQPPSPPPPACGEGCFPPDALIALFGNRYEALSAGPHPVQLSQAGLWFDTPKVYGALDKDIIRRVVQEKHQQLRYCYRRELTRKPGITGQITMKWVITGTGSVTKVSVMKSTMGNESVEACLRARIQGWRFPKPRGGIVIVSYPFAFTPPR